MTIQTILLVDDDEDIRRIATISLERVGGFVVWSAGSCDEAIARAVEQQPDLILLDVMMPEVDGPETLARLRATESVRHIPVVFLTARVQTEEVERYQQLGVVGIVKKPFDPMTLPDQVRQLFVGSASRG